jgi:dienelactone hydrolase
MRTESLEYEADGLQMVGHLVWSRPDPQPGILVFPDAGGLGEHAKARANRLASEFGFVALACDLYGQQEVITDFNAVMERLQPLRVDASRVRARAVKALNALAARPEVDSTRIAAIGFCFGGTMTYELALTGAAIKAAIGFHSGLKVTSPGDSKNIKAKILALLGADDPSITIADRTSFEAMLREGSVDSQITCYGGVVHSFTNEYADRLGRPEFARYDARADARSWKQMGNLLEEVFR